MDLSSALGDWRNRLGGHTPPADVEIPWPALDAEQHAARARVQAANRNRAYSRSLPAKYVRADYRMLRPNQNPAGRVSRWLASPLRTLVLSGPPRTGKTTAAYAIANDAHRRGSWVIARPVIDLSAALKPDGEPMADRYARDCDVLLLDDLGQERATEWWVEQLYGLVDARCAGHRRLVVTTNCEVDELADRYGEPILERLMDGGGLLKLTGPSIRQVTTEW